MQEDLYAVHALIIQYTSWQALFTMFRKPVPLVVQSIDVSSYLATCEQVMQWELSGRPDQGCPAVHLQQRSRA